jgi:Ni,Fe-hydrogenase III small subunit/Pyruvate/2-oxoacid:ferredoxin oxidoreductase delta subunit
MFKTLRARLHQGHRTVAYPAGPRPVLSDRYQGLPVITQGRCQQGCQKCSVACPTAAIAPKQARVNIDLGRCLFCGDCVDVCPDGVITFSSEFSMATRRRGDLVVGERELAHAAALDAKARKLFGRSLKLRQVSAGGCNACEADVNVLNTVVFDLSRFGIGFVASPRHADGILITGPVPENMRLAVLKTYEAVPPPKLVIAVGACAISGGPYRDHAEVHNGVENLLPVDLFVPGCPPHPLTILDGLLRMLS